MYFLYSNRENISREKQWGAAHSQRVVESTHNQHGNIVSNQLRSRFGLRSWFV
jgi:hypothetical protein